MSVDVGDKAPEFTLPTYSDQTLSLKDLKGKTVVLYFYPKDMTPGCTTEAGGFRDRMAAFEKPVPSLSVRPKTAPSATTSSKPNTI